ncbi:MAG: hypothetical protein Q7U16_20340 [Agitococcus sp.]|nr:hypothetical protein [Agitococcus sp.]
MKYKPLLLEKEVLKRYPKKNPRNEKIDKIIKDAVILCNRSREFNLNFPEKIGAIINQFTKTIETLQSLNIKWNAINDKENAIQSLAVILSDLINIREDRADKTPKSDIRIDPRDHPHFIQFNVNRDIIETSTGKNADYSQFVYYQRDYAEVVKNLDTVFTEKDVLKIATACILEELKKFEKDGKKGRRADDAKNIIMECFPNVKSIRVREFYICTIQDDDNNICLSAPNAYTDKTNFKNSKMIFIKDNKAETRLLN